MVLGKGLVYAEGMNTDFHFSSKLTRFTSVLVGLQHRKQRKLMNPTFSASYVRNYVELFQKVGERVSMVCFSVANVSKPTPGIHPSAFARLDR